MADDHRERRLAAILSADLPAQNPETWFVPGGTATAMLYTFKQPSLYAYLNHAHVQVEGEWNDDLMKQVEKPGPIRALGLAEAEE